MDKNEVRRIVREEIESHEVVIGKVKKSEPIVFEHGVSDDRDRDLGRNLLLDAARRFSPMARRLMRGR
jgi:hypothetical protein